MTPASPVAFILYCLAYGAGAVGVGCLMYFLCEGIEKAIEILEGDVDG